MEDEAVLMPVQGVLTLGLMLGPELETVEDGREGPWSNH